MPVFGKVKRYKAPQPRIVGDIDISGLNRLSSILHSVKIKNQKVESENNTLGMLKTQNELIAKSDEIFNTADETGDYEDMMKQWDSSVSSVQQQAPAGMNEYGKKFRDLTIKKQHLITKDKIADYQTEKRAYDIATQAEIGLKELVNNAIRDTTSLSEADNEIYELVNAIPGSSPTKKEALVKAYRSQLTNNTIDQMIKEDPNIFLKNASAFENRLTKNEFNIKKKQARSELAKIRKASKEAQSEAKTLYESMIDDQISSMTNTGSPVDPNLVANLKAVGSTKEAIDLIKGEDLALKVFDFNTKTADKNFDIKFEEAQKIRPIPGDINFDKKQTQYEAIEKKIREDYSLYLQDPVKYLDLEVREFEGDANIFAVREAAQIKMGTPASQVQLFSESEKSLMMETWNANESDRAKNLTILLSTVPDRLQDKALDSINIEEDYKNAYKMAEGSMSRKSIMFSALNQKTFDLLKKADRQKILTATVEFSEKDNTYLKYYTQRGLITGNGKDLQVASNSQTLFSKVASYFKEKGYKDYVKQTSDVIFGPTISVIANDVGIGIDSQVQPFDDEVQNNLNFYLKDKLELSDVDSNVYSPVTLQQLKQDGGIWIQSEDGFILWNKYSRNAVKGADGGPIIQTYSELTAMREKYYQETITTRLGL